MSEERTTRYHVRRREFLNDNPELPAFIIGVVEDTRDLPDDPEDHWKWGTVVLDLADCSRRVSFDFDLNDAASRANSLRKINLIAEVVNGVRDERAVEVKSKNARPQRKKRAQGLRGVTSQSSKSNGALGKRLSHLILNQTIVGSNPTRAASFSHGT